MHHTMRRKERAMDDAAAWELLKAGEYGVLSTVDDNHQPYGVPLTYVVVDGALFMHAAKVGHKLENIRSNSKVAFCVVGDTELLDGQFSLRYQSVVVFGTASVLGKDQKRAPLEALIEKYFPGDREQGSNYIDKLINETAVIKVAIDRMTGKVRK
jgi:uncharacterized protein